MHTFQKHYTMPADSVVYSGVSERSTTRFCDIMGGSRGAESDLFSDRSQTRKCPSE